MADNFDDELALLYDDILTRLNKGETLADIDLDSLIEVYDYAYDLSDEFVTAEIMNNVLQRDPDFQPMLERKAFRYALLSEIQGAKCVANILPESSFVKKLINMQTDWDATDWRDSYRRLFADVRHQSLDEYSAMCLIDLALGVDNVAHLSLLLEDILPLCRYPEDFLVDLSGTLLDNDMPDEAVTVLLELTTLQPFSLDYWLQLAELYINRLNNFEEGYNAIDYALAIDPDSGSALMLNSTLLGEVVQAVREGSKKPVTVKMRAGVEEGKPLAVECASEAEKMGAAAVAVHPRYRTQFYSGSADHSITRAVKDAVKIPVIANGDIVDKSSLERVKEESGADIFMIGRGALGRPYIFAELDGRDYEYDRGACVREHIEILRGYLPDKVVANVMKLQLCHYAKGEDFAKTVRVAVGEAKCLNDIFAIVDKYLD